MTLEFTTTAHNQDVTLPLYGTVDVTVDWGDIEPDDDYDSAGDKTHNYALAGTYTVSISGNLTQFGHGC